MYKGLFRQRESGQVIIGHKKEHSTLGWVKASQRADMDYEKTDFHSVNLFILSPTLTSLFKLCDNG